MTMLDIHNLHVRVGGKPILQGIDLRVNAGEVHAIMGPNGSGKSTLARALSGHPDYQVTEGEVSYEGRDLLAMDPEERAREGVFMAFQYPVEIPGVNNAYFLKAALNAIRRHRGQEELDAIEFMALMREKSTLLEIDPSMLTRSVNEGFSGGEKKRNEIFQMAVLEPKLAILDETDSGLDIDALKLVANGVNAMRSPERAIIVVTHYQRLLDYIVPDVVHVLSGGRIVKSGDRALALELEDKGYGWLEPEAAAAARPRKRKDIRMTRLVQSSPQIDAYLADCDRLVTGRCRDGALMAAESAPEGDRALRGRRLSYNARGGMEVHQRRADRRPAFRAGAGGQSGLTTDLVESWAGALGGYRLVLVNGALCATVFRRRVAHRRAGVQSAVHPGHEPGGRGAVSRPVRTTRSAGVHGAEHGFPPGRRVRVDPAGHDHRTAHFAAVRVGITRDRQRVAPARPDRRWRPQSGPDRRRLRRSAGTGVLHERGHGGRGRVRRSGRPLQAATREPARLSRWQHVRARRP